VNVTELILLTIRLGKTVLILCGGMYRSGSTYQFNIASAIVELRGLGGRAVYSDYQSNPSRYIKSLSDKSKSHLVLKCHDLPNEYGVFSKSHEIRCFSSFRDIYDVVASWQAMNRRRLTTKEGLQFARMAVTSFAKWEQLSDGVVKIFSYDRMIAEPKMTCRLMGEFLGVELSDTEIDSIADKCSVASLKTRLDNATEKEITKHEKMAWDSQTLVHLTHFNGGTSGKGKNELHEELLIALKSEFTDWQLTHGFS
jgi:hypothetical protein